MTIPPYTGGEEDIFVFPLTVVLPGGKEIDTGYGCPWPGYQQTAADYIRMAGAAGFTLKTCQSSDSTFSMVFVKTDFRY